jgi:CO/xanthine dehydrogenase FAD-binding subunit
MNLPDYIAPSTLDDALHIKSEHGADAICIAGGTDLILRMKSRVATPKLLIDLRQLPLDTISAGASDLRLGARVTESRILADTGIAAIFPALTEACRQFAGPPIRNRGTVGGNLVNASPAADLAPPLMAYDASVVLASAAAVRLVPLAEFFTAPGCTVMAPDEILTEVRLPSIPANTVAHFIKLGQRRSMAISIVNLVIRLSYAAGGEVVDARIVLGAVAPTPMRARQAEAMLTGEELSDDLIDAAAREARREAAPISDVRASKNYREKMVEVLVHRALESCRMTG